MKPEMKSICTVFTSLKGTCSVWVTVILSTVMLCSCDKDSKNASLAINMSGSWKIMETITGNCSGTVYPYNKMDIVAFEQISNSLTVVYSSLGTDFTGSVTGRAISFSGNYLQGDGTNTINFTGTLSEGANTFTGTAAWSWSDGESSCSGNAQVTGTKVAQIITDVEGQWAGEWESDNSYSSGPFTVNIYQTNKNLSGTISVPLLGLYNADLTGTFSGNSIVFGDIDNDIIFYGVADSDSTLTGCYKYSYFDEDGMWQATKVN